MKKTINQITTLNVVSTFILQGIAFLTSPIFSRLLGTSNYGIVSVYNTWVSIITIVFTLQAAGAFAAGKVYISEDQQEQYQSSAVSLAIVSYLCFSVPTLIICCVFGVNRFLLVCLLVQGITGYMVTALNNKFTFELDALKNLIFSIVVCLMNVGLSLILISLYAADINYKGRILGTTMASVLCGLFAFIYIFRRGKTFCKIEYWKFILPITIPTIFHLLGNLVLAQSDRLMINAILDESSTGIYSLSVSFTSIVSTIYVSLNNAWVPFYYEYTKKQDKESIRSHSGNYLELYTIVICGFMLLSREVFKVFGGQDFFWGSDYIPLLAVGAFFVFLYSFPVNYEFYHKKTRLIAIVTVTAAISNIVLNMILIKSMGVMGAVVATLISYVLQFTLHYISARFIIGGDFPYRIRVFLPFVVIVAGGCAVTYFLREIWIVRWSLGALLGVFCIYKIVKRKTIF